MQELGIECNHDLCSCLVKGSVETGEAYCSDACRRLTEDSVESENCPCGHPPCDVS